MPSPLPCYGPLTGGDPQFSDSNVSKIKKFVKSWFGKLEGGVYSRTKD